MNSIKSLITETEKEFEDKCFYIGKIRQRKEEVDYTEWHKCKTKLETLKLCQEIQDAKVKELKDEMQQAKSGLPCKSAGYHTILELIYEIDKIFGEKLSQAVKE
jgi:hypothetical protein